MKSTKHLRLKIHGKVQGVFFRSYAKMKADEIGIFGWVKNNDDGTVLVGAEGEKAKLEKFLRWCHDGSPGARVEKIEKEWKNEIEGYVNFKIIS